MVSSQLKQIILLIVIIASPYGYARLPIYEKTQVNSYCSNNQQYENTKSKISSSGRITDERTMQLTDRPKLVTGFKYMNDMLMFPFPQQISDKVSQDRMYGRNEIADNIACLEMFEIDYHKVAYHLFYLKRKQSNSYQDIGTIVLVDDKKKSDFLLCKEGAENIIEHHEQQGTYRKSYEVGIGIPFGFNNINQFNRKELNGVPSDAVQCQIKALPRENADHEYILYYTWKSVNKGGIFGKDKIYTNERIVDHK